MAQNSQSGVEFAELGWTESEPWRVVTFEVRLVQPEFVVDSGYI